MDAIAPTALDACPLCRTVLRGEETACPSCGGDLRPFIDAQQRLHAFVALARNLLARGESDAAARLIPQIAKLTSVDPAIMLELRARLALASGDRAQARALAAQLSEPLRPELERRCAELELARRNARELYNSALWQTRQGAYAQAAEALERAVGLDPQEPRLWLLKLKADLKTRRLQRCYADLSALDRLQARPPEYARLESLLPALRAGS